MESLFQDKLINTKTLESLARKVKQEQIERAVKTMDVFFELRKKLRQASN